MLTRTKHEEKGLLIDAFYLGIKGRPMGTHGDSVFVREQDEDGSISIVRFRVAGE